MLRRDCQEFIQNVPGINIRKYFYFPEGKTKQAREQEKCFTDLISVYLILVNDNDDNDDSP